MSEEAKDVSLFSLCSLSSLFFCLSVSLILSVSVSVSGSLSLSFLFSPPLSLPRLAHLAEESEQPEGPQHPQLLDPPVSAARARILERTAGVVGDHTEGCMRCERRE